MTSMTTSVSIVDFKQVNVIWGTLCDQNEKFFNKPNVALDPVNDDNDRESLNVAEKLPVSERERENVCEKELA